MRSPWLNKLSVIFSPRPPVSWLLLCFVSVLALISVFGSSSSNSFDSVTSTLVPEIYTNYRRLKEQATVDYFELRTLPLGASRQREFGLCGKEKENYVPCYNVTANLLLGFKDGEEFDRHCEFSRQRKWCLVRPPKDYKIPLRWPAGRDVIWSGNVKITKDQFLSSGSMTKRMMLLEENQIAFHSEDGLIFDGVKDYSRQIAEMMGLGSDFEFFQAGVRTVLDIGCGFGSFGAHLVSLKLMALCIAAYEATGSQVQLALERGLPAMIGNFISRQLPYPSLSFDMVHCAQCSIVWDKKEGMFLIEADRLLKPGGYFVLTSPTSKSHGSATVTKKRNMLMPLEQFTEKICWSLIAQQDETFIWQKTADVHCYSSRKQNDVPLCKEGHDAAYYQTLMPCITGTSSKHWIPIQNRSSSSQLSSVELEVHGVSQEDFFEDLQVWKLALNNYWSLLTPLIFSDHPKRPGDEDPLPPFNMVRNVMDMNAHYGGLNAAFLEEKKSVWVMNVVPVRARNTLPLILDRGFPGVLHDWCEPFPTYPRTYDMIHANGLLTHLISERCGLMDLFIEMDRILRPEGWVVLSDKLGAIDLARAHATQIRWDARVIDLQNGSDQRLLVCQKPFLKK
ncbi:probable methyltransferase PMT5 [Durio zibethinus]|uniref:Methyltransferase n=1 Tax=Durio zibethinus TaxID=66656 RepID=A0A6P6BI23_DURZI|nr:probable methyltransferase PMT5 [Durio zibethinus]XP_022776759.1 probable methyltransferase PMT5 [Durio zibethinus]XP_022776760.1 probable methyltransferase PMT5 [Durio zibethinus]XP_022776761.1 probable methyltransferase PMT5 [Durio zibethinus]